MKTRRDVWGGGAMVAIILVCLLCLAGTAGAGDVIAGRASVIDGDTIEIHGARIRLHGIDAPESGQWCLDGADEAFRCGQASAFALADRIAGKTLRCQVLDHDRYDRSIGRCLLGELDLNAWLVRRGHAVAYRRYSTDYVDAESEARAARTGLWQGSFDWPWTWRRGERTVSAETPADGVARGCAIKGNVSRHGRIYHMPGQQDYGRTRIDETGGERWFCSESEAQAAGWRRAER